MAGRTKIWNIVEFPGYQLEQTPGGWVLWGKCDESHEGLGQDSECGYCGGTGDVVLETCDSVDGGVPSNPNMINDWFHVEKWTPERVQ